MRMPTGNTAQLVSISTDSASTCGRYFRNDEKNYKHRRKCPAFQDFITQRKEALRFNLIKETKERMIADTT